MWVLGQGDATRQAASAWQDEVEKAVREVNMNPRASSPYVFDRHGDDVDIVTRRWHAKEIEKHLRSKSDVEVQTFWARR